MDTRAPKWAAPAHTNPAAMTLPFGGLGLDLAEARRKVQGLVLEEFPQQETPWHIPLPKAPTLPSGYGLLLRLSRETLGS